MKLTPIDVRSDKGELTQIEFYEPDGEFYIQAVWDNDDEHTPENEEYFRKWAYKLMRDAGHEVNHGAN